MTVLATRGEALCQSAIRKFLESAVNPPEAESFFYNVYVWENSIGRILAPRYNYPALLFLGVVIFVSLQIMI